MMQKFLKNIQVRAEQVLARDPDKIRYAGFNIRLISNMFDMLLLFILTLPLLFFAPKPDLNSIPANAPPRVVHAFDLHRAGEISDAQFTHDVLPFVLARMLTYGLVNLVVIGIVYVLFWRRFNSTPGKMLFHIKILDEKTMSPPTTMQYIVRFFGYIISTIPFMFGFMLIGFNRRKKGLHDFIAGTVVVYTDALNPEWERKKLKYQTYFMIMVFIIGVIYLSKRF